MKIFNGLKILYISEYDEFTDYLGWCIIDALKYFGATIYCCDPKIKWQTKQFIRNYGVNIIFIHQNCLDRLPIKVVNDYNVFVFIIGNTNQQLDIKNYHFINTNKLSPMGNLFVTPNKQQHNDVFIYFNQSNKPELISKWIVPLTKRLLFLNKNVQIYGCELLKDFDIPYCGNISFNSQKFIDLCANSNICVNIDEHNMLLHSLFCGGFVISNFVCQYCEHHLNITDLIQFVEHYLDNKDDLFEKKQQMIKKDIFIESNLLLLKSLLEHGNFIASTEIIEKENKRLATQHLWKLQSGGFYE